MKLTPNVFANKFKNVEHEYPTNYQSTTMLFPNNN